MNDLACFTGLLPTDITPDRGTVEFISAEHSKIFLALEALPRAQRGACRDKRLLQKFFSYYDQL